MIEQLFGSKTRVKLLKLFFSNPNRSFYVREITRMVDEQINSVRRELANLLSIGLITSDSNENRLYYEVNQDYEHYNALRSMFAEGVEEEVEETETVKETTKKKSKAKKPVKATKEKEVAAEQKDDVVELAEAKVWSKAGNLLGVAYSGVYTRDDNAIVDIVVIGDAVHSQVVTIVTELEKEKNRELRYTVMDQQEWQYRRQVRDKFWQQIMDAKKQIVLDKEKVFSN